MVLSPTKFLDLNQQAILKNLLRKKVDFSLFGGYEGAELKRASINSNDNFDISCIKISYNPKYLALSHQNILGTLLSLSIEKSWVLNATNFLKQEITAAPLLLKA